MENKNFIREENRVYLNDDNGNMIAEIDFPLEGENLVNINHTYVSSVLRGKGVAGQLMENAVDIIEKNGWNAKTSCSYAQSWRDKHPEKKDLFV
ncbi:GNAT family N-acetyltransferase [Peptostreptococcus equinus]|uniref:GNAT family N-acetyltransferase n=1 Tax=Peptostreptococcus equinus TaxID=3003601 RepID=A0ABY7JM49_9FIRM|nr:GNAT family N-acetyltransferase [Peptostreptococcus sp. CBA3647]WAW14443.1 GNAT family N-acetyltransferase [Peptostreptococcus sp. CBA3647]